MPGDHKGSLSGLAKGEFSGAGPNNVTVTFASCDVRAAVRRPRSFNRNVRRLCRHNGTFYGHSFLTIFPGPPTHGTGVVTITRCEAEPIFRRHRQRAMARTTVKAGNRSREACLGIYPHLAVGGPDRRRPPLAARGIRLTGPPPRAQRKIRGQARRRGGSSPAAPARDARHQPADVNYLPADVAQTTWDIYASLPRQGPDTPA